jgi:hypothetical protein
MQDTQIKQQMPSALLVQSVDAPQAPELQMSSSCRLLSLAAELRNHICQYALTSPHELYMILDRDDNPPEIFENPGGLNQPEEFVGLEVFNQLKFTCRQLHYETAGIEVRHNRVRMVSILKAPKSVPEGMNNIDFWIAVSDDVKSAKGFINFFATCASYKAAWFKDIFLGPARGSGKFFDCDWAEEQLDSPEIDWAVQVPDYFLAVAKYCRDHPHVTINVGVGGMDTGGVTASWHISYGIFLTYVFGGKDLRSLVAADDGPPIVVGWHQFSDLQRWHLHSSCAFIPELSNLRFWAPRKTFDEEKFRRQLDKCSWLDTERSIQLLKQWATHGLLDYH